MKRTRRLGIAQALAVLVAFMMFAAACGGSDGTDTAEDAADETTSDATTSDDAADTDGADDAAVDTADTSPVKIGGLGPLAEPGAVASGIDMQWAMELAVTDLNEDGGVLGRDLDLVFGDTQNTPEVAISIAKKLIEEDEVVGVVGEYHSGAALAAIPTYTEAGMPVIFAETWGDAITGGDPEDPENLPAQPPTVFRIAPTSSYFSAFAADWLLNGAGADKVIHIFEATDFGIGADESMSEKMSAAGIELVSQQVELNQPDYASVLTRLADEHGDADVVIFGGVTGDSAYTVTQNGFDVGLVDDDTACFANFNASQTEAYWAAVPDGTGCAFVYIGPAPSAYNDITERVASAYTAEFGGPPGPWVFESYDAVLMMVDAIERAGSTDSAAIVAAIESTSITGAQGAYEFPYGSANTATPDDKPWLWHQWPAPAISMVQYTESGQALEDAAVIWPN